MAGLSYPQDESALENILNKIFKDVPETHIPNSPILLIEPHAGYIYSGRVAAFGYRILKPEEFKTIIILGPSHRHYFFGASVDTLDGHKTPLGITPFDKKLIKRLLKAGLKHIPPAHNKEHSIEVQLPFLQYRLKDFKVVEIVIGDCDLNYLKNLASKIFEVVKKQNVLIIASSDLSHYHSDTKAREIDQKTIEIISNFDPDGFYQKIRSGECEACGGAPIVTGLHLAKKLGANMVKPLIYTNSGEITKDTARVVGYLSAVAYKKKEEEINASLGLSDHDKKTLKKIARSAINAIVRNEKFVMPELTDRLKEKGAAFVTIKKMGRLRGCIGFIVAIKPLYESVFEAAQSAACRDPRFSPLSQEELREIEIEISVLTEPVLVEDTKEITIGRDGLIIKRDSYLGLLLPQVATDNGWDVKEFLNHTCLKAGLPPDAWKQKGTLIYRFGAEVF